MDKAKLKRNYGMAFGRAPGLRQRLKKTGLFQVYRAELDKLIELDYVEQVDTKLGGPHAFIPHHPVVRVDKTTSKVRPMFDGSAKK